MSITITSGNIAVSGLVRAINLFLNIVTMGFITDEATESIDMGVITDSVNEINDQGNIA